MNHFLPGECTKTKNIFCDTVSSISMTRSPGLYISLNDLPTLIPDGALGMVVKKPMLRVSGLIGLLHSSNGSDSISVHRKLLCKHIVKMRAERRPVWENARNVMRQAGSETDASNEVLAEVTRNWPPTGISCPESCHRLCIMTSVL